MRLIRFLALLLLPVALPAQTAADLDRFYRSVGLSLADVQRAQGGSPVVLDLKTSDKDEVAVLGVIATTASYESARAQLSDVRSWLARSSGRTAMGVFSTPAQPTDAAALQVFQSDLDAFRSCRPRDCNIKLPTSSIQDFKAAINWSSPTVKSDAEGLARRRLARYADDYRKDGTSAVLMYEDQPKASSPEDVFEQLLSDSPYMLEYVPALHQHLLAYPQDTLAGGSDDMFWAVDKLPSLRPITSLVHATFYEKPGVPLALLGEKQIYSSHYFDGAFFLTTIVPRPDGYGTMLIVIRRMHFDNLPSGPLLNIRARVVTKLKASLADELYARANAMGYR